MLTEHEKNCIEILLKTVMLWGKGNCNRTFVMYANKILKKYDDFFCIDGSKKKPSLTFLRKYNIEYKNIETNKVLNQTIKVFIDELYEDFLNDENFHKFVKYMQKYNKTPKYKLGQKKEVRMPNNSFRTVFRIIAEKDFSAIAREGSLYIKKGDLGGYIETDENLSQTDASWIMNDSVVCGTSQLLNSCIQPSCIIEDCIIDNCFIWSSKLKKSVFKHTSLNKNTIYDSVISNSNVTESTLSNTDIYDNTLCNCGFINGVWVDNSLLIFKKYDGNIKFKNVELKQLEKLRKSVKHYFYY